MKKLILFILSLVFVFAVGCNKSESTLTMYVANCNTTQLKQMPKGNSLTLKTLKMGQKVQFEKADKNGYSKVKYRGNDGYILSDHLSTENPKDISINDTEKPKPSPQTPQMPQESSGYHLLRDEEIEDYVVNFVRPVFSVANENPDDYTTENVGEFTVWYDSEGRMVKKTCAQRVGGPTLGREYYYDTDTGKLIFAFLYHDLAEYRLYFYEDTLVRFISNADSEVVNNPTSEEALTKAEYVLDEAY